MCLCVCVWGGGGVREKEREREESYSRNHIIKFDIPHTILKLVLDLCNEWELFLSGVPDTFYGWIVDPYFSSSTITTL